MGAPVLVAETPVRVQWATQPTGPGGVPIDGATLDGVMLPGPGAFTSKQEQLDYAVVRPSSARCTAARPALTPFRRSAPLWLPTRTWAGRRRLFRHGWRTASSSPTKTSERAGIGGRVTRLRMSVLGLE